MILEVIREAWAASPARTLIAVGATVLLVLAGWAALAASIVGLS